MCPEASGGLTAWTVVDRTVDLSCTALTPFPRRGMASPKGAMASELSEARMSVSVSCASKRLVEVFSMTTVTGRRRANDRRSRDTKNSYHNMPQLGDALPRPSEARKGECPTTRGRAESLALSLLVVPSASKR